MSWSTELEPLAQDLGHACLVQNKKLNCAKDYTQSVARIRRLALAFRLADVDFNDMGGVTSLRPLPEGHVQLLPQLLKNLVDMSVPQILNANPT